MGKTYFENVMPKDFEATPDIDFYWMDFYLFYRDKDKRPLVIECLLATVTGENKELKIHKGFSICSLKDNPFTDCGKAKALARASDAMRIADNNNKKPRLRPVKRIEALETLQACNCEFIYDQKKGQYDCKEFTEYENKIVNIIRREFENGSYC